MAAVYQAILETSEAAGMPREELDWYFTAPSAPSVEDFLLDDPHIADQGYAWEIAQNPKSAMAARKGELLRSGVGGSEATLREWITLLHMEEAHDAIAEVGDSTLSEDELFHRFLEQELAAAAKPARPSTGAPPPPAAAYKEDSHTSLSDWGAATGSNTTATRSKPPVQWTAADYRAAGCAVRMVELNVPVGKKLGLQLQKPAIGQLGVEVSQVTSGGAASRVSPKIRVGDVVVEVDGKAAGAWRLPHISQLLRPKGSGVRVALVSRPEVNTVVSASLPRSSGTFGEEIEQGSKMEWGGAQETIAGTPVSDSGHDDYSAQPRSLYDDEYSQKQASAPAQSEETFGSHQTDDDSVYGMRAEESGWGGYDDEWNSGGGGQESGFSFRQGPAHNPHDGADACDSRWEVPEEDFYTDDPRWGGRFGGRVLSPVLADQVGTHDKTPVWRPAQRADKTPAHTYVEPAGSVTEANNPLRPSRDIDRINPHDDFKLRVKSDTGGATEYIEPAGNVAEANNPQRAPRDLDRMNPNSDFKTAVRTQDAPAEYVAPAVSAIEASTRAPRDLARMNPHDDFKVPLKGKKEQVAYNEPAGSVADANNPKLEIRRVSRLPAKYDFKTIVKGGIVPLPALVHEPYVDPGKKRTPTRSRHQSPGSPNKAQRPRSANPRSPSVSRRPTSTSRLPIARGQPSARSPMPSSDSGKSKTPKTGGFGDTDELSFETTYYNGLVEQFNVTATRYKVVWSEYQTVTRQHSDLVGECRVAGLPCPAMSPPTARWDPTFDDASPEPIAGANIDNDLSERTSTLRRELQSREKLLRDLEVTVEAVKSVRDSALFAAMGIAPRRAVIYRCSSSNSFGIQLETDERRALLPTRISGTDPNIQTRLCEGIAPQRGDIPISVNGMSSIICSHETLLSQIASSEDTITIEFVDPYTADKVLAATARFVRAADAAAAKRPESTQQGDRKVSQESTVLAPSSDLGNRYPWQDGLDFRDKMEARAMELGSMDIDSDPALQMEFFTLQEIRAGLGIL